ncbi:uncharacterized protein LOC117387249 [Periophthalmus magnuspinnatus]|uniref:uncharacterized protein LOC117387249 n=1 Tax=Periophthalmus magnuspinnatus TaxID=409849 RepID=UPI00145BCA65|nr:uncharacterized protein LOC117387249 [Periophthalmus magnuspinnatus]
MRALWCSCVLGLLCLPVHQGMENTVIGTQIPSSTTEMRVNSSVNIMCSITSKSVLGLSLDRRFNPGNVVYLFLNSGQIGKKTITRYKGRADARVVLSSETDLKINFSLSQLQVDDTDLYFCRWKYYSNKSETFETNGSIIIINDRIPKKVQAECGGNFLDDVVLVSLSVMSIPFVICILVFSAFLLHKRFQKKFTPSRPANNLSQSGRQHICPRPLNPSYHYLSTSVSLGSSQI